jgi:ribonuclease P protein component
VLTVSRRFRPQNRLNRPAEYKAVFSSGKRLGDRTFLIIARQNRHPDARLGLAIPKKHIPLAVNRNRIKRIIRESFRKNKDFLKGWDVVVLVKQSLAYQDQKRINQTLDKHWKNVSSK